MSISFKERFARALHPYLMVLRQGGKRPNDLFDFSLALLHRHAGETLPRPNEKKNAEAQGRGVAEEEKRKKRKASKNTS